jgi:hypothetical protein
MIRTIGGVTIGLVGVAAMSRNDECAVRGRAQRLCVDGCPGFNVGLCRKQMGILN